MRTKTQAGRPLKDNTKHFAARREWEERKRLANAAKKAMRTAIATMLMLIVSWGAAHAQQPPASHAAVLTWQYTNGTVDPAVGFNVYRAPKGGTYSKLTSTPLSLSTMTYTDPVGTGVDYLYYVTAVDAQGKESDPSNVWESGAVPGPLGVGNTLTGSVN